MFQVLAELWPGRDGKSLPKSFTVSRLEDWKPVLLSIAG